MEKYTLVSCLVCENKKKDACLVKSKKKVSLFDKTTKRKLSPWRKVGKRIVIECLGASKPGHAAAFDVKMTARKITTTTPL